MGNHGKRTHKYNGFVVVEFLKLKKEALSRFYNSNLLLHNYNRKLL